MHTRREFLKKTALGISALCAISPMRVFGNTPSSYNILYVFADQLRAQSLGYAGCGDINTPKIDLFAASSVNYANAVSNLPVCSPYRASMLTGQYPLSSGMFLNDLHLRDDSTSIAEVLSSAGYTTGFIGKWHINANGRGSYIPPENRQGFEYFKVLECTHSYNNSKYYANDDSTMRTWSGYDAYKQTDDAIQYLNDRATDQAPFALFLAWGPPHNPYRTGPTNLLAKYDAMSLTPRPNVNSWTASREQDYAGYYAHTEALDISFGQLMDTLAATGLDQNTIVVFTSDHGDMLYSHGLTLKQRPQEESLRVPFLIRIPGNTPKTIDVPLGTPDIMPTLLGLNQIPVPLSCDGIDLSDEVLGIVQPPDDRAALILNPSPSGATASLDEWRGVRTKRYTYTRTLAGPWLLYDNQTDPYQMTNLVNNPSYATLQADLDEKLNDLLCQTGDTFKSRTELMAFCGYDSGNKISVPCRESGLACGIGVNAGADMITWSDEPVQLAPTVTSNSGGELPAGLVYAWSASPDAGVVFSATDVESPAVTITKPSSTPSPLVVTLTLDVGDGVTLPLKDTMTIDVYDDACQSAIASGLSEDNPGDINGDCKTDLTDFAEMAQKWLSDSGGLTGPVPKLR